MRFTVRSSIDNAVPAEPLLIDSAARQRRRFDPDPGGNSKQ